MEQEDAACQAHLLLDKYSDRIMNIDIQTDLIPHILTAVLGSLGGRPLSWATVSLLQFKAVASTLLLLTTSRVAADEPASTN